MAEQAVIPKGVQGWGGLCRRVEGGQPVDCIHAHLGGEVRLGTEGIAYLGDGTGVSTLDAADHALDVVAFHLGGAAVTFFASAGGFHHLQAGWVGTSPHAAVSQVGFEGKGLTSVAQHASKGLNRVGRADLRDIRMAGQAVFHLSGNGRCNGNWGEGLVLPPEHQAGSGE